MDELQYDRHIEFYMHLCITFHDETLVMRDQISKVGYQRRIFSIEVNDRPNPMRRNSDLEDRRTMRCMLHSVDGCYFENFLVRCHFRGKLSSSTREEFEVRSTKSRN